MTEHVQFDKEWLIDHIIDISKAVAVLPEMEEHLKQQNNSIAKMIRKYAAMDLRIIALERLAEVRAARWQVVIGSLIKVAEGLVLAYLLWRLL